MKIEMGESLGYSYLRHVKNCWLVQTNWKASKHWEKYLSEEDLESVFRSMRQTFDLGGSVFKGTKDSSQFLRQAEVDVVGVAQDGTIHAIDVAFHEAGLNYGGGVGNRVLKKLLRTVLVLMAYHEPEIQRHIYFVSPKVHRAAQQPLENIFDRLQKEYPTIGWHLFTNETFATEMLAPTLEKGGSVADLSELFLRSFKLLQLAEIPQQSIQPTSTSPNGESAKVASDSQLEYIEKGIVSAGSSSLQDIVRGLMTILLEKFPSLLTESDLENMNNADYCRNTLGLSIGNLPLIRESNEGREISGHSRYWRTVYGGRYFVSSQWWKDHHLSNARGLQVMVSHLMHRNEGHSGIPDLQKHWHELNEYIGGNQ